MLIKPMQEQTETLIGMTWRAWFARTGEGDFWGHFVDAEKLGLIALKPVIRC